MVSSRLLLHWASCAMVSSHLLLDFLLDFLSCAFTFAKTSTVESFFYFLYFQRCVLLAPTRHHTCSLLSLSFK